MTKSQSPKSTGTTNTTGRQGLKPKRKLTGLKGGSRSMKARLKQVDDIFLTLTLREQSLEGIRRVLSEWIEARNRFPTDMLRPLSGGATPSKP